MIYLTRKERFNAAHKLFNPDWTDARNDEVFGKCANKNWHGHNFDLYVTVKGAVDSETGFVINLKDLSKLINELVIDKLDHKNVNLDVPFMKGKMASTENLAIEIWQQLDSPIEELGAKIHKIYLRETENNSVEYFGL
jgi:6-pyruvoyltetrahydropterin/6-carboxytetrahydropterin synthase